MKRFALILLLTALLAPVSAQLRKQSSSIPPHKGFDMVEVGVRGAMAFSTLSGPLKAHPGIGVGLDVVYRGLFLVREVTYDGARGDQIRRTYIGPMVGLGGTYSRSSFTMPDQMVSLPSVTSTGYEVTQTLNIAGSEQYHKLQLEVPLMVATSFNHFTLNAGLVGVAELAHWQQAELTYPQAITYIPYADLSVVMPVEQLPMTSSMDIRLHLYAAVQLGYEWAVTDAHRIGVQAFFRYDMVRKNLHPQESVGQWTDGQFTMKPYTDVTSYRVHYGDVGIRLYYAFARVHRATRLGLYAL